MPTPVSLLRPRPARARWSRSRPDQSPPGDRLPPRQRRPRHPARHHHPLHLHRRGQGGVPHDLFTGAPPTRSSPHHHRDRDGGPGVRWTDHTAPSPASRRDHRHVTGRRRQRLALLARLALGLMPLLVAGEEPGRAIAPRICTPAASSCLPRRKRSRTTSPSIPACCGSSRARSSGGRRRANPAVLRRLSRRAVESEKSVSPRALYRLRCRAEPLLDLEGHVRRPHAERRKAAPLASSQPAAGADRARRAPIAGLPIGVVAVDEPGTAVLRDGARALPRAPGPA